MAMVQVSGIGYRLVTFSTLDAWTEFAMPTADDDAFLPFSLPSIGQKKVTAAFDGGRISSDGGVILLAGADKRLGLIDALAAIIPDHRVVTNITHCHAQWLYDSLYCARGEAENMIKRHKSQLASDRTSCRSPLANQMRLFLHTAAYWLVREIHDAIPQPQPLANGEFSTIRLRLLKIAVRIKETATRVKLAFASNCPDAALFRGLVGTLILRPT
jgi:Transposase DDE domain group 1